MRRSGTILPSMRKYKYWHLKWSFFFFKWVFHYLGVIFLMLWAKGRPRKMVDTCMYSALGSWISAAHRVEAAAGGLVSFPDIWLLQSSGPERSTVEQFYTQLWNSGGGIPAVRTLLLIQCLYFTAFNSLPTTLRQWRAEMCRQTVQGAWGQQSLSSRRELPDPRENY